MKLLPYTHTSTQAPNLVPPPLDRIEGFMPLSHSEYFQAWNNKKLSQSFKLDISDYYTHVQKIHNLLDVIVHDHPIKTPLSPGNKTTIMTTPGKSFDYYALPFIKNKMITDLATRIKLAYDIYGEAANVTYGPSDIETIMHDIINQHNNVITNLHYLENSIQYIISALKNISILASYCCKKQVTPVFYVKCHGCTVDIAINTIDAILNHPLILKHTHSIRTVLPLKGIEKITPDNLSFTKLMPPGKLIKVDSLTLSQERNIEHFSEKLINLAEGLTGESLAKVSNSEIKKDTSIKLTYKDEQGNTVTRIVSGERDIRRYNRLHVKFIEIDHPGTAILMPPLDRSSIVNNAYVYVNKNDLFPEQYCVKKTLLNECEMADIQELLELGSEISTHVLMHKCIINYSIENVLVTSFYVQDAGCTGHYIGFLQVPIISSTYRMINVFMSEHGNLIYNAGCFYGNEEELTDEINSTHSGNPIVRQMYFNAIKYIKEVMSSARVATLDELREYVKR